MAACIALAISIGTHTHSQDEKLIEVTSVEEAQIQTERALMAFSQALNKGLRQIEKADETTARTNERFQNCIK